MAPKIKDFTKPNSKTKSKVSNPESENDFLEAAEEFEQGGGKWRAGDAAKAARFFQRAIQMYDQGMKTFPNSFDLAYNKAHLEYEICEDERIASHLSNNRIALLQETLISHRAALLLQPENFDIQFNTGQVLSSLAEASLESEGDATAKSSAREMLEEACNLFTNCLVAQQRQYEQMSSELANFQAMQGESLVHNVDSTTNTRAEVGTNQEAGNSAEESSTTEEWATVEEVLTPEVILETCTAQLNVLTTLLGLYDTADLPSLEKRTHDGLHTANTSIPTLISLITTGSHPVPVPEVTGPKLSISGAKTEEDSSSSQKDDALLSAAIFQCAVAEASHKSGNVTTSDYINTVSSLFAPLLQGEHPPETRVAHQSAYADALIELAGAVSETSSDTETQWNALSQAQGILAQLCAPENSPFVSSPRLADIFIARADIDLTRFNISFINEAKASWISSRKVLISNSGIFYRGAKTHAEKAGNAQLARSASAMAVVAEVLKQVNESGSGAIVAKASWKEQSKEVRRVLEQMVNDKMLGQREGEEVLRIVGQ